MWLKGEWRPLDEEEFYEKVGDLPCEFSNYNFIPKIPEEKRENLKGVGIEFIDHPHFNVWQDYFARFYKRPKEKDIALFLPCSKRKPYYKSQTHKAIRRTISGFPWYKRIHIIVISNPGVIPIEFSDYYPFNSYDWDERLERPDIMKNYIRINTERIKNYLKNQKYKLIFSFFKPESESGIALENACKELGLKLIKLADEKIYRGRLIHSQMLKAFKEKISKIIRENI